MFMLKPIMNYKIITIQIRSNKKCINAKGPVGH